MILIVFLGCLEASPENIFRDFETIEIVNRQNQDSLPNLFNFQLQGGYFAMPSARTRGEGEISFGFSRVSPYQIWSLAFQPFNQIEATANYWIFSGMLEKNFGHLGFGDDADRAVNIKFVLLKRRNGFSFVPNFALGWNDFLGSQRFNSFYAVATQEFLKANLEISLGWGSGRIQGLFGGIAWSPWRYSNQAWKNVTLVTEYDANNYTQHGAEHPSGRIVKWRVNSGIQFTFLDLLHASVSTLRGEDWAASISFRYNLGKTAGLFPKLYDPPTYDFPKDHQYLGHLRSQEEFGQQLAYAFKEQGLDLHSLRLVPLQGGRNNLWLKLVNIRYREENIIKERVQRVIGALIPDNIELVTIVMEADGLLLHEYRFRSIDLRRYCDAQIGEKEFNVISPLQEVCPTPNMYSSSLLYQRRKEIWVLTFRPWLRTFFGSSTGKFKYETGLGVGPEGYLFDELYYSFYATWTLFSSMCKIATQDILNPSKIINVRTDTLKYNQSNTFHLEQAFLQKSWNHGIGWFSRLAFGYFEIAYAGMAAEALYYPVQSNFALGFEVAGLVKRNYSGLGLQKKIRKFTQDGFKYFPYLGFQYFIDLYYEYKPLNLDFKISVGQFLARDKGIRMEVNRTFASSLRVGIWYTLTNAGDVVNNERYYDKGFSITMPLDLFLNKSSRTRIGYAMSAWLRDCGAIAATGKKLYHTLYFERFNPTSSFY